jgi:site-specific DNA recombinase
LQRRYDEQYDTIEDIEVQIGELQGQIRSIQQEKISGNNIYRLLLAFDEVYHSATEAEQKEFMKAFIERIEMFPEKRKDGSWIRKIVFNFPVPVDGEEVKELPLETETTVETIVLLSQHRDKSTRLDERGSRQIEMQASRLASLLAQKPDDTIESDLDLDELDATSAELKARD